MIKKSLNIILLTSLVSVSVYAVEIKTDADAVNIAGKQRMYSQRMIKDYAMVGMENTFGDPKNDLQKTADAFSDGLTSLKTYTKDAKIQEKIKETESFWKDVKKELLATPDKNKALQLRSNTDKLFLLSNEITGMLSGEKSKNIVNISGKQRMLSQKMASLYMFKVWNIDGDTKFDSSLKETMNEFKDNHSILKEYKENTPEIKKNLSKVSRYFKFFEIMSKSKSKFVPSLIYKKSNDILKKMNETTKLYVIIKGGK